MLKIAHVALSVSDLDKSISFYGKNFGFSCVKRYVIESLGLEIALVKKDDVTLELFKFKHFLPLPEYRRDLESDLKTLGTKHIALEISNIEETFQRLQKSGVTCVTDIQTFESGSRYFFIKDADGNLVELMES